MPKKVQPDPYEKKKVVVTWNMFKDAADRFKAAHTHDEYMRTPMLGYLEWAKNQGHIPGDEYAEMKKKWQSTC